MKLAGPVMWSSRRGAAWIALIAVLCATVGILPNPVWVSRWVSRVSGERFPCEDSACGCPSAEHCWTECRCQTMEEKIAWAEANGVPIPHAAVLARGVRAMGPECPMCASGPAHDADAVTSVDDEPRGPSAGGLPCVAIRGALVMGVVVAAPRFGGWDLMPPYALAEVAGDPGLAPSMRSLDVDTPPPRHA